MTTTPDNTATIFDDIVALFNEQLGCEMPTQVGGACRRPARWRIDLHGCEQVNMCGQHKTAWLREQYARYGQPRCDHCNFVFATIADAVRITAI